MRVLVDTLATGGEFVCRCQEGKDSGKKAFVRYVAPGELVSVFPRENKKSFMRGMLDEIIEPSKSRIKPRCAVFGACGGCDLQHLSIKDQRELKRSLLETTLDKHFGISPKKGVSLWSEPLPDYGYRNRVRLQVNRDGMVGFYGAESHTVIPISMCPIAENKLEEAIKWVSSRTWNNARQIELRATETDQIECRLIDTKRRGVPSIKDMPKFIRIVEAGSGDLNDEFSQVNNKANEALHKIVNSWVTTNLVTELYSGSGNFSFELSEKGCEVDAVEASEFLVRKGESKAKKLGANIKFFQMKCEQFVKSHRLKTSLLLDPPRSGAQDVVKKIDNGIEEIVYVSCNPSTLGRDLQILSKRGYTAIETIFVDMFPQTAHIESVTLLKPA